MQILTTPLDISNYCNEFALKPLSEKLSCYDKVIAFAITFFATLFTGGVFLLGLCAYQWCCITTNTESDVEEEDASAGPITSYSPIINGIEYKFKCDDEIINLTIESPITVASMQTAIAKVKRIDPATASYIRLIADGRALTDEIIKTLDKAVEIQVLLPLPPSSTPTTGYVSDISDTYSLSEDSDTEMADVHAPEINTGMDFLSNRYRITIIPSTTLEEIKSIIAEQNGIKEEKAQKINLWVSLGRTSFFAYAQIMSISSGIITLADDTQIRALHVDAFAELPSVKQKQ